MYILKKNLHFTITNRPHFNTTTVQNLRYTRPLWNPLKFSLA